MEKRVIGAAIILASAILSGIAYPGEGPASIQSNEEFEEFSQRYYLDPHPELVESAMHFMSENDVFNKKENAQDPIQMWFSCIVSQYQSERAGWSKVISSLKEPARTLLANAMAKGPAELLSGVAMSPARNDLNWACYFATGNMNYLNELIATLQHLDERKDLQKYLAASTAEWSLASVAQQDEQVRASLVAVSLGQDPKMRLVANDILTKPISEIKAGAVQIIQQQRKAGVW